MGSKVRIVTAQNVEILYEIAGVDLRLWAHLIDFLVKVIYILILLLLGYNLIQLTGEYPIYFFIGSILALPIIFYSILFERFNDGQSFGKKAMDIKVVSVNGNHTTTGQFLIRWLFRLLDFHVFYGVIAFISIAAGEKGQRLGDRVANTCVILLKNQSAVSKTSYTEIDPNYNPTYQEANSLSAKDITNIKAVLRDRSPKSFMHVSEAASQVEELLEIRKEGSSRDFLNTIIKDYNYYQLNEGNQSDLV